MTEEVKTWGEHALPEPSSLIEAARALLIEHEDIRLRAYDDATGKTIEPGDTVQGNVTIGIGRNLYGKGLAEDEAVFLVNRDILECARDLKRIFGPDILVDVGQARAMALIDLRFNLGPSGFRGFHRFIENVQRNLWSEAATELKRSLWYYQVGNRAPRIIQLIREGR